MKTLKMFIPVLAVLILSIITGCSEVTDPVSSSGNTSENNENSVTVSVPLAPAFQTYIRLKPHRAYTFNISNTGLSKITGIDIENVTVNPSSDSPALVNESLPIPVPIYNVFDCEDLSVYGSTKDDLLIGCHTRGFDLKKITVENVSSRMLDLKVSLYGIKAKKKAQEEE